MSMDGPQYPGLNIGCGKRFSPRWINIDLYRAPHVLRHDVRRPLPFPEGSFGAAYASHLLEHLDAEHGGRLLREAYRVLRPGGVARIVVPDLEYLCRGYLDWLRRATEDSSPANLRRYEWTVIELIDQMVRSYPGGRMGDRLRERDFDVDFVRERCGDEFAAFYGDGTAPPPPPRTWRTTLREWYWRLRDRPDPRRTGEAHRWMYDRLSLKRLLEQCGFTEVAPRRFNESAIPQWDEFQLDRSLTSDRPAKPESLYMEGRRP